ncbi:CDP-alcohol phosphatidyltransferase family protein [Aestuariivirga sp.]|uniref:CDP-alcohol phosphatidyltransferase family protein n=1 Tax=Aestuariivirga sp. TaxID=2650926 RepID=UPI0039E644E9
MDEEHPLDNMRSPRFKRVPVRFLLPNLITLLALCSGITAIRLGVQGRFELAVGAVMISIILDAVDGRLARFLKGTSRFGAELELAGRFREFRRGPGHAALFLDPQPAAHLRLDHCTYAGHLLRSQAGKIERGAG